ncbi:MAG TPA: PAS domain S-box protein [Trichocoleus sp.]
MSPPDESARLAAIIENMAEGLIELDASWRVACVNRLAEQFLNQSRQALLGQPLEAAFAPAAAAVLRQQGERAITLQQAVVLADVLLQGQILSARLVPAPEGVLIYLRAEPQRLPQASLTPGVQEAFLLDGRAAGQGGMSQTSISQSQNRVRTDLAQLINLRTAELFQANQKLQREVAERRQVEATLQHEQDFLKAILDNVKAGIVACDAQGILTIFNRAAQEFHGLLEQPLPPEQWADYYDLYQPDGKTPMRQEEIPLFRALQGQTVHNQEMMIVPKQGTPRILLANGKALTTADGETLGAVVVMHDITERKHMENALRQSQARLASIFQTMPDGVIILDTAGQITTANDAAEAILRLTHSDITERSYNDISWDITTPDGDPFPEQDLPFVQVMRTGKPIYGVEHAITHRDGGRTILSINASPLFDTTGEITSVIAVLSDITERVKAQAEHQQAEDALRESEDRYRSVIEAAAEGIVLQHADGSIFTCNDSAERILGLTAEQMMGRTSLDPRWCAIYEDGSPFPGELHPAMVTLRTGEPQSNVIMGIRKPDGTLTWISINTRPIFTAKVNSQRRSPGEPELPFAVVVSFFEITDRMQVEQERVHLAQEQVARSVAEFAQERSAFLAEVSSVLGSSLDYEQTLQSVANLAVPYFADWCSVDLLNEDRSISRVAVAHSDPEKVKFGWELARRYPRRLDDGYGISKVMQTGQSEIAIEIPDELLAASIPDPEYLATLRQVGLKSCIMAPLKARDRVLGSISFVFTESDRRYSQTDLGMAEDLARRAAIAIDNARLFQQTQLARQAAETAAKRTARLQGVTAALSEPLTSSQVATVIVEQSLAALDATAALVALVTEAGDELEIVEAVGYEPELVQSWQRFSLETDVPLANSVRTGQPAWTETLRERIAQYPHLVEVYARYDFQSWMSLPLIAEGKALGGMLLSFREYTYLNQDDKDFVLALTSQCAQAIFRAQLYEAERRARSEAEQANRIKDEFLAVLSHELRSPLNPILGWARLLRQGRLDAAKTSQAIETIERNAKLQVQLIEDLLDVSRIIQGKLSLVTGPVDLAATVEAALETVQLAAEAKSITIRCEGLSRSSTNFAFGEAGAFGGGDSSYRPSTAALVVLGDSARLQQVIWNLLSNAVKFTPEGGQVDVRLEQVETWESNGSGEGERREARMNSSLLAPPEIPYRDETGSTDLPPVIPSPSLTDNPVQHSLHPPQPFKQASSAPHHLAYAQITVSDTGKGITPDFLPHVFDTFRQADSTTTRTFGGLGLGLAIVRQLVELHGGTVQVSSPGEGQGATFIVRLPLRRPHPNLSRPELGPTPSAPMALPLANLRVLLVDDEVDTRDVVAFTLEQAGATVVAVASVEEALAALQQPLDLVISDIGMPERDGYQFIRQVRSQSVHQGRQIPAIALTAYASESDRQQALAAGFQQHLSKPIEPDRLVAAITQLLGRT